MIDFSFTNIPWSEVSMALYEWSIGHGLKILFILVATVVVNRVGAILIERVIRKFVPPSTNEVSTGAEKKREDTLIRIVKGSLQILLWIMATLMVLSELGINIGPLIAAAGVVGLALGFGGQYLIKDLISGFFIILENQYRIGDVVCFDKTCGLVEDISLRATVMRDLDGVVHHVPHGTVGRVSNLAKQFARVNLNIGVSYSADLEEVIKVINETGQIMAEDPDWKDQILKPVVFSRVEELGDSAVVVKVLGDTTPLKQWAVTGEFRKRIKIAFDKVGIEIPFPQRVIHHPKE